MAGQHRQDYTCSATTHAVFTSHTYHDVPQPFRVFTVFLDDGVGAVLEKGRVMARERRARERERAIGVGGEEGQACTRNATHTLYSTGLEGALLCPTETGGRVVCRDEQSDTLRAAATDHS